MNAQTTNTDWHPGEDDDYMRAAIARVRERCGMSDERPPIPGLTRQNTGVRHDVYKGWYVSDDGMAGIERRMNRRQRDLAAYHAPPEPVPAPARKRLPARTCAECGVTFLPGVSHARYHSAECQRRASKRRAAARRQGAA